jgi:PAP2 superfamily
VTGAWPVRLVCRALLSGAIAGLLSGPAAAQCVATDSAASRSAGEPFAVLTPANADLERAEQPAGPPPTPRHTGVRALVKDLVNDYAHLPSRENAIWLSVGGGLALAGHPYDDNVNEALVGNSVAENIFGPGAVLGQFATLISTSTIVYAVGRIKDQPKVSHMGMDLIQSLIVSQSIVQGLKLATQRERPDGSSKNSFPSGHAADTFAFATALQRHLGWRGAVPAYIGASYVAISRLPANRHWLSDVLFGASVGIVAGRTVTRHGRDYPVSVQVVPGGLAVAYAW